MKATRSARTTFPVVTRDTELQHTGLRTQTTNVLRAVYDIRIVADLLQYVAVNSFHKFRMNRNIGSGTVKELQNFVVSYYKNQI